MEIYAKILIMKYPDGSIVAINDIVWWNEGLYVGKIDGIYSSPSEINAMGLNEPSISIRYDDSSDQVGCSVIYPISSFRDEGIGKLTIAEIKGVQTMGGISAYNHNQNA